MTKIYLQDSNIKRIMLEQYHPYITIDLWNLQQEELEQFAQISDDILSINSNDIFITINTEGITNATLIIYNHDYDNDDDAISINDYLLFQKAIDQSAQTHTIYVNDLNRTHLEELNDADIITVKLYDSNNTIYARDYKIIFNEDKTSFYCLAENTINDYVNLKIIEKDIEQLLYQTDNSEYMLNHYKKYVSTPDDSSSGYDNIIFTPQDDWNTIIPFEYYKGTFYLRLPYFCQTICLHIISKYYDATDNVALFTTDDMIEYLQNNPPEYAWLSERSIENKINTTIEDGQIARYLIDLPQECKEMSSIEIDAFYLYTGKNPEISTFPNNQLGIVDSKIRGYSSVDSEAEDQKTSVANVNILQNSPINTNEVVYIKRGHSSTYLTPLKFPYSLLLELPMDRTGFKLQETHQDNIVYETTIKYFNDDIYVEEYNPRTIETVNRVNELQTNSQYNYMIEEWREEV